MRFKDRSEAGIRLAEKLEKYKNPDTVIYALPRGGVVVGYRVALHLNAPLDILVTRKIGHPQNPEYAVCAVAEDGHLLCNEEEKMYLDKEWLKRRIEEEREEARRRSDLYIKKSFRVSAKGKIAIIVDDGVATGLTLRLAIEEVKHEKAKKIIAAVPVAPKGIAELIKREVDEFVAVDIPRIYMGAVGAYYDEFGQVRDEEVIRLLDRG